MTVGNGCVITYQCDIIYVIDDTFYQNLTTNKKLLCMAGHAEKFLA
jgi:hypothetical protein